MILTSNIQLTMKKFINFLSLALIAMLSFASCGSDNNEPSNSTPANYLEGKTFVSDGYNEKTDTAWGYYYLVFTSKNTVRFNFHLRTESINTNGSLEPQGVLEYTYTYVKPELKLTLSKVIKDLAVFDEDNNPTTLGTEAAKAPSTFIVHETLNTITYTDSEGTQTLTLKK